MSDLYLVTGGAGFLGINLIRYLLARNVRVRSFDIVPFDYPERSTVTPLVGDVRDSTTVDAAMTEVNCVVHCAAALPLYSRTDIMTTEIEGTRNVLQSAVVRGVPRVVHVSSTAVYGLPDHHPLVERDELVGVGPYGEAKILAERSCEEYRSRGLCVPVLRPKTFVGPERLGVFQLLYEWAYEGRNFPIIGAGTNRYQLLDVEDLCQAIFLCATQSSDSANTTFNVGAEQFTTLREDLQAVLDEAGHGRRIVRLPQSPAIAALKLLQWLKLSPFYPWIYETVSRDSFVSIEKIKQQLGFQPQYSNREALIRNYRWYVQHRDEFIGRSGVSHRTPWKHGALALAKWLF